MVSTDRAPNLFNSPLETGLRALVVLEAMYPRPCDLMEMTWFDHLVVHTGDLGGGEACGSLHPDLPNRNGELLVRRSLVEASLTLMQRFHLVDLRHTDDGIQFLPSDAAPSFLATLQASYTAALKARAKWLASQFKDKTGAEIQALVSDKIGRWTAEFQLGQERVHGPLDNAGAATGVGA